MSAILYKDNPYGGTTSVTDAGHVLVTQGSDTTTAQAKFNTQTTAIQRILGNFATVEQSTTASKAYNVGDYLVLNSFLYKVTQAIAAGGTIDNTQNGNVVKITVADEFSNASNAQYDNTTSGLTATNVQDALDEVADKILNPEIITIPLSVNSSGATGSGEVKVYGRVATLSAVIHPIITGITMSLGWLQGGGSGIYGRYAPSSAVWLSCDSYDASGTRATAEAKMLSDAVLSVSTSIKDVDLKISGSWITKG